MTPAQEQAFKDFLRQPEKMKAAGVCVGIFLAVIYLGFSLFYGVRWYGQTRNWPQIQGVYKSSEVSFGRHSTKYVQLQYDYQGQSFAQRVQLSFEQLRAARMPFGSVTSSLAVRVNPNNPKEILVDPRSNSWSYGKQGVFFLFASLIWYGVFEMLKKDQKKT